MREVWDGMKTITGCRKKAISQERRMLEEQTS